MKIRSIPARLAFVIALSTGVASSPAAILSVTGNDTLVGNRPANLITNGSFEADGGVATNGSYWATGTSFTPTMSLTAWMASGQSGSYAIWGNDGLGGIRLSDPLPHGTNGLYFGAGTMASVNPYPVEANNGLVTFASAPVIQPKPTDGPVTLEQTVSGLNPSATYLLDFWTSGEEVGSTQFPVDGFFGLDITGEATLYFAAPSGNGPIGNSQRYQVYFTPTSSTVTFRWVNWGHYFDANGFLSDEIVLDDVILNQLTNSPTALDCNCITNITLTCPASVPDLCALFAHCFGTNMMPGSCTQNFPPGFQLNAGNYSLNLTVQDMQSNYISCPVQITVLPPVPEPPLTVTCPTNKTVECGSGWSFDSPIILSSCCGVTVTYSDVVLTQTVCSEVIERTFTIMDGCGNQTTCTQKVTTVDTTPPGRQCGVNLVPNPSFERYTNCPNSISYFDYATPWFTPTDGTTDLFSPCAGPSSYVSTPTNMTGVQIPLTGQGYAGAAVWSVYGLNTNNTYRDYREYLEVQLLSPLFGGQRYQVSFYVSRADNRRYAIAELGACITPGPLITNGFSRNFNVVPQVENPATNMLASTNSWMLVQGTFIATGGESFLTIGNFRTDANTTWTNADPAAPAPDYAYYLFDDVSVVMLCDPLTNKVVQCGDPWVWDFNDQTAFDNCSGLNVTATSITTTNGYCPRVIQRDWSLTDACGNTNLLTQTVTIVDTNPPFLMCTGGANLAPNPSFENNAYCPWFFSQVPAAAPWFNPSVATPDYFNSCTTFPIVSTPTNFGGTQTPLTGQAYVGAFVYSRYGTNPPPGYREYIEAPLLAPLVAGVTYQVSFRVNLADHSGWAISEIGAHFSSGPVVSNSSQSVMTVIPQVVNPSANLLTSTNSWMLVQGTFTAVGGENYITLGNFRTDALTTAVLHLGTNSPSPSFVDFAYYYFEDIAVVPLCSFTNKTVQCGTAWGFDTPLAFDTCSGDFLSTYITSTTSNGTCPPVLTRVWTIYDACSNSITATQSVTVVDTQPPILVCSGVNLVPNPGFENYSQCPMTTANLSDAWPWYSPTDGTSDYYNACAPGVNISVPTNWVGVQNAFTGQAYGGGYVFNPGGNNDTNSYREYLQVPLLAPMIAGQSYAVSFRVNRADNYAYAIAEIGAHFSVGPLTNGSGSVLTVVPQLENPSTNVLTSTNAWMLIQGIVTGAGGENFLTLGNFRSDANTTAVLGGGLYAVGAYYLYDEVSVVALCQASNKIVPCGAAWSFDLPVGFDTCSGTNVTVAVVSTITNSLCPLNAQRTWSLTDACGNATNWSQTVSVSNSAPFSINCDCLMDSLLGQLSTNACNGVIPLVNVPTNSPCIVNTCGTITVTQSPPAGTPVGPGAHNITLNIFNCSGNSNQCVVPFYVNPPQPTITCPPVIIVNGCSNNSAIVNYSATATGNVGPIVYSPPSGSIFPLGVTFVTCTATNSCGGVAVCGFNVIVKSPHPKWGCFTKVIGIITYPPPTGRIIYLPDFPGGGMGVDFENLGSSGQDGVRFELGAAEKFTFSTMLDFNAPDGASFALRLPPDVGNPTGTTLLSFRRTGPPPGRWDAQVNPQIVDDPSAMFRSVAIGTNGELFSSFTQNAASLATNDVLRLSPMAGATGAVLTVTLDCRIRELVLHSLSDTATSADRKGWDGCIYGNGPRGSTTNKNARVIITPLPTVLLPPITTIDLVTSNLTTIAFDNPSIHAAGRKWSDGHVTLMKAYDDGTERGMEFFSLGAGGGVQTDLGHAASFQFRMTSLDTNGIPPVEQQFAIRGWPPGTTTNRPPPPIINLRLAPDQTGLGGVNVGAEFVDWGVSNVTIQLWNGTTLVAETNHVPATLAGSLVTLGGFPRIIGCPAIGVVSLSDTNLIVVASGLDCGTLGCVGTELRIIAETSTASTPPTAYTGLECFIGENMDYLIHRLQTTPACFPVPLHVTASTDGINLTWEADGFHLQGAESVSGPWYDLEVDSPVTLPANSAMRVFRLRCE